MLLVSISFIINTSILSLSLSLSLSLYLFFFTWLKGILPFLTSCISILEKKKKENIYIQKNGCYQLDQSSLAFFCFCFLLWLRLNFSWKLYMPSVIKSSRSNIRIWSLVVLSIFYFVFVLTVMISDYIFYLS